LILLIDNYDSFVFNLQRYFVELGCETRVVRNDNITVSEIRDLNPAAIVLSPGPCTPSEAGICVELVQKLKGEFPILGVCLGHQSIAAAFGADIVRLDEPIHGRTSEIEHESSKLFAGLSSPLVATRYHSLIVDEATLPSDFSITARTSDGLPMAIEHSELSLFGVQFHPESILTNYGHQILANFLSLAGIEFQSIPQGDAVGQVSPTDWDTSRYLRNQTLHW